MAKMLFLHQISCRVNQQTQLSFLIEIGAMNYVPLKGICQKELNHPRTIPYLFRNRNSHPTSIIPSPF